MAIWRQIGRDLALNKAKAASNAVPDPSAKLKDGCAVLSRTWTLAALVPRLAVLQVTWPRRRPGGKAGI